MDISDCLDQDFPIAQWLERWYVKPGTLGSIPGLGQSDNFSQQQWFDFIWINFLISIEEPEWVTRVIALAFKANGKLFLPQQKWHFNNSKEISCAAYLM